MTKIIGLTGGIASGKSTVTNYLRKKGFKVIDADQVVHDLQEKGGALYQALLDWLGPDILGQDGQLNRPKLAELIFSSQDNLDKSARLQGAIIHQKLAEKRDELAEQEEVFFMDIPLLIEQDYIDWFDQIWLVALDKETQLQRLMDRNTYSKDEAAARIASQMSTDAKKKVASHIIDNSGSLEETYQQLDDLLDDLLAGLKGAQSGS
ncbi:dephospho-CoA kinase [Streptococcus loxodontisalivarius]|uniref:Dephospho-CoA kinase n=1 Tax=Streptococcus loxodontisalivarius TaxID=1349415 RepID=A0ABS2PQV5_9STRE|nr:dephospho-CoA kinase [Streptococcus loxodontisalivarius]MBM7642323.1 dephospho-CoA kinase [Streptococcus loxodontisalivarius]